VTIHLSKLLDLVQVLLLALSQAGEDLAVAWVRVPAKEVQQLQRALQGGSAMHLWGSQKQPGC
jgi:hypothetical protein